MRPTSRSTWWSDSRVHPRGLNSVSAPYTVVVALLAAAVERRVAYVPGTAFYPDGRGTNKLRLAFCYPTEDRIREGVARLGALLHEEAQLYRSMQG